MTETLLTSGNPALSAAGPPHPSTPSTSSGQASSGRTEVISGGTLRQAQGERTPVRSITIAILAMGGEGGGVLADWLVDLAEQNGYFAQTTSVPGVAQRTGATVYYLEMVPEAAVPAGRRPVMALSPVPG
ncbi:MAG: hypothetical protein Q8L17_16265, partial [Polaromonas sp.]|nr:hypothetical protein [Polaromonas sp.]